MSFVAKTHEGYVIKVLSELLSNNIKVGCFVVSKQGISFRMTDTVMRVCIDIELNAENFDTFNIENDQKILLGINMTHLRKMLKPVKKKESIEFMKKNSTTDELSIKICPKETNGKTTISFIKIQEIQTIDMTLPSEYDDYVSIPASDYQKMCKDMDSISQDIEIKATKSTIQFTSDMTGIYSRSILFGTPLTNQEEDVVYLQHFESERLSNLSRMSGLGTSTSSIIQVFSKTGLPILFKTNVGSLGKMRIFVKSKEQIESEKNYDE